MGENIQPIIYFIYRIKWLKNYQCKEMNLVFSI